MLLKSRDHAHTGHRPRSKKGQGTMQDQKWLDQWNGESLLQDGYVLHLFLYGRQRLLYN